MVKFISYNGKYPNLCSGTCVLEIEGKKFSFGWRCDYPPFWESGGSVTFDKDWEETVTQGAWQLTDEYKREEWFSGYIVDEMIKVFNDNVPHGCCGGCV